MATVTLNTDAYTVTFDDAEILNDITCAFNRFNGTLFDNALPHTKVRWAFSIRKNQQPGSAVGLLALPEDPQTFRVPSQFRLEVPHIFINERLKGLAPLDQWVLLHEMCHFRVPHHGTEFIDELRRVLEKNHWSVLLGGY